MSPAQAQAELSSAQEAHAAAKQAFFDSPTDANAGRVTKAELLIERAKLNLAAANDEAAERDRAEQLERFEQLRAEQAAGNHRIEEIMDELVGVERRARALLFELVGIVEGQRVAFYPMKQLSLALDQPTPLRAPPDLVIRRYEFRDRVWNAHHDDEITAHPLRHIVSEWLQRPERPPGRAVGASGSNPNRGANP